MQKYSEHCPTKIASFTEWTQRRTDYEFLATVHGKSVGAAERGRVQHFRPTEQ